jgi:hypothetical protein
MNAQPWTMGAILKAVAELRGFTVAELKRPAGPRPKSRARQEAMYEMRQRGMWSYPQIAKFMGLRDHQAVLHGERAHAHRTFGAPPPPHSRGSGKTRQKDHGTCILELNGSQDGIRFGTLSIAGRHRSFFHDRLNGTVRIYRVEQVRGGMSIDNDKGRVAVAKALLEAAWALERAGCPQVGPKPVGNAWMEAPQAGDNGSEVVL